MGRLALLVALGAVTALAASQFGVSASPSENARIDNAWALQKQSSPWRIYQQANPNEAQRLDGYLSAGGAVPTVATLYARSWVEIGQVRWPVAPPPPPPPPPGNVVEFSGTVGASTFESRLAAAPTGPVTVRPAAGNASFTVAGNVDVERPNVTVQRGNFASLTFAENASGGTLEDSSARFVNIYGADNVTVQRNKLDGQCLAPAAQYIMPARSGAGVNGALNFRILSNDVRNYHNCADESDHSEAYFVGARSEGLFQGNFFTDSGTTAHIFFTWWGGGVPEGNHPRNICVKGNHFQRVLNPFFHINFREEIPASANIDIEPPPSNTVGPERDSRVRQLTMRASEFERTCG